MTTWQTDPVCCEAFAALAGARNPWSPMLSIRNGIAYCPTHCVPTYLHDLADHGDPLVLVTHASDASTPAVELPPNVKAWFSSNATRDGITPLPIGFIQGARFAALVAASRELHIRDQFTYVCFTDANHAVRGEIRKRALADPDYTVEGGKSADDIIPLQYYRQIKRHEYIECPRGAGIDTHRFWESCVLGATPIVSPWNSEDQMAHRIWGTDPTKHDPAIYTASYWIGAINHAVCNLV